MKKFFASLIGTLLLATSLQAASVTVVIANSVCTNVPTLLTNQPVKVTQILLQNQTANTAASCQVYDCLWPSLTITNSAYSIISSYATNQVHAWTNYYNVSNGYSGLVLVDYTNNIAATNVIQFPIFSLSSPTNTQTAFTGLNQNFLNAMMVTNTGVASLTMTVTYTQ